MSHSILKRLTLIYCLIVSILPGEDLSISPMFGDHMVLQRERPQPVWGRALPGTSVRVRFQEQEVDTRAGEDGRWRLTLAPEPASFEGAELEVSAGGETLLISDILVGEVWLASGQSNMQWTVARSTDGDMEKWTQAPGIRMLQMKQVSSGEPLDTHEEKWRRVSPESIQAFSAVGWHFARTLYDRLNVPVGIVESAWGGTPIIAWIRPESITGNDLLEEEVAKWEKALRTYPDRLAAWELEIADWKQERGIPPETTNLRGYSGVPRKPNWEPTSKKRPSALANGMISPLVPFAMRGVVWYQGENDTRSNPDRYDEHLEALITGWREAWGISDLYFGVVQLPNFNPGVKHPDNSMEWPALREAQRRLTERLPHTGLAVTIDLGEENDIHPWNKLAVGRRLGRLVLSDVYQLPIARGGPEIAEARFGNPEVRLVFETHRSKLRALNRPVLEGFELAGADGVFHEAVAEIVGSNEVLVSSPRVENPVHVRYAWGANPANANLFSETRLPAGPFEMSQ